MTKTLIVAATKLEVNYLIEKAQFVEKEENYFTSVFFSHADLFICGVGMMESAVNLAAFLSRREATQILHIGIAGSLTKNLQVLDIVLVESETYGDLGSNKHSVFDLGLKNETEFPFVASELRSSKLFLQQHIEPMRRVKSISVNSMLPSIDLAAERGQRYKAHIEHMEGVGVFYVALKQHISVNAVRVISNVAGEPDKSNWKIKIACQELGRFVLTCM